MCCATTWGRYQEAEPLYIRAIEGKERVRRKLHAGTLGSINNLATHYADLARYSEVERLHARALGAQKRALGKDHTDTLTTVNNLAGIYRSQGTYSLAEAL